VVRNPTVEGQHLNREALTYRRLAWVKSSLQRHRHHRLMGADLRSYHYCLMACCHHRAVAHCR
jgi:hypothetical protein